MKAGRPVWQTVSCTVKAKVVVFLKRAPKEAERKRSVGTWTGLLQGCVSTTTSCRNWECCNWHAKYSVNKTCEAKRGGQCPQTLNNISFCSNHREVCVCVCVCVCVFWLRSEWFQLQRVFFWGSQQVPPCGLFLISAAFTVFYEGIQSIALLNTSN